MPDLHVVRNFIHLVESGRFVDALQDFYHPQATVWENRSKARSGINALIANEQLILSAFISIKGRAIDYLVNGDRVAINWCFEFIKHNGKITLDEIAYQRWSGDRIIHERFYYDPVQIGT